MVSFVQARKPGMNYFLADEFKGERIRIGLVSRNLWARIRDFNQKGEKFQRERGERIKKGYDDFGRSPDRREFELLGGGFEVK